MKFRMALIIPVLFGATLVLSQGKEEKVENPYFKSWQGSKVGTQLIYSDKLVLIGKSQDQEIVHTLTESKADGVRVKSQTRDLKGKVAPDLTTEFPVPAMKSIPAKAGKEAAYAPNTQSKFEKMEKVKVAGKTYDCRKFVRVDNFIGEKTIYEFICPDVPGMIVKIEEYEKSGGKLELRKVMELKEIKPVK